MKRYWVKVVVEVREYDEKYQRILPQGILSEFATNLTPEPDVYIGDTLRQKGEALGRILMVETDDPVTTAASPDLGQTELGKNASKES